MENLFHSINIDGWLGLYVSLSENSNNEKPMLALIVFLRCSPIENLVAAKIGYHKMQYKG